MLISTVHVSWKRPSKSTPPNPPEPKSLFLWPTYNVIKWISSITYSDRKWQQAMMTWRKMKKTAIYKFGEKADAIQVKFKKGATGTKFIQRKVALPTLDWECVIIFEKYFSQIDERISQKNARTFFMQKMLYTVFITLFTRLISVKLSWRCSESCFIVVTSYTHLMFSGLLAPQWMRRTSGIWERRRSLHLRPTQSSPVHPARKLFPVGGPALDVVVSFHPHYWTERELNCSKKNKFSTNALILRSTKHQMLHTQSFIFSGLSSP